MNDDGLRKLLVLLALLILPSVFAAQPQPPPVNSTTTTMTSNLPGNIVASTATQKTTYRPTFAGHGSVQDRGPITYQTTTNGFIWNKTAGQTLQMGVPSLVMATALASLTVPQLYYNSTVTQYRFAGFASTSSLTGYSITVSFKPSGYSSKVSIDGSVFALTTLRIPFNSTGAPIVQASFVNQTTLQTVLLPRIQAGSLVFDWSDIPASFTPTWNNVSHTLAITLVPGVFHIDPLALDGNVIGRGGGAASFSLSLTTANTNDVIVVGTYCDNGAAFCTVSSVSDVAGLSWSKRGSFNNGASACSGQDRTVEIWWAISAGTLSADSITVTFSGANRENAFIAFGVSGADTISTWDGHAGLPAGACGSGGSVSTSNANDFIFDWSSVNTGGSATAGAGWTLITSTAFYASEYQIVASTQTNLVATYSAPIVISIADAIKQAATTITQPIKIITANSAPSATITIAGCSTPNGTFTANGNVKHYTLAVSCTVTLSNPAPATYARYVWNISPKPLPATSITFSTCAGPGTCTEYDNTTFYQLKNNYTENSLNIVWDAEYIGHGGVSPGSTNDMSGVFLGTTITVPNPNSGALKDMCALGGATINAFFSTFEAAHFGNCHDGLSLIWADYNQAQCLPTTIGNTWTAQGVHCWNDTTGNNNHQANYVQSTGTAVYDSSSFNWLLLLPVALLAFIVGKKL